MKKLMIAFALVAFLFGALPSSSTSAAPLALPQCSISKWNPGGISGGCTCYVAERVKAAGRDIPWGGNAGSWWANSNGKWVRKTDEPRPGAIAAFSYGHVSYVDSVKSQSKSQPAKVKTQTYFTYYQPFPVIAPRIQFKVAAVATQYQITETYKVNASQRDYTRILKNDNSIRYSSWEAKKISYYWSKDPRYPLAYWSLSLVPPLPQDKWSTPRAGGANGLQGYIYP